MGGGHLFFSNKKARTVSGATPQRRIRSDCDDNDDSDDRDERHNIDDDEESASIQSTRNSYSSSTRIDNSSSLSTLSHSLRKIEQEKQQLIKA